MAWTEDEDQCLRDAVARYGIKRWAQIAAMLPGRTSKACSHRWRTYLQPGVMHTSTNPFTDWEVAVVKEAHKVLGNNWSAIAKMLPGRTNAAVKNFWYAHKRRCQKTRRGAARQSGAGAAGAGEGGQDSDADDDVDSDEACDVDAEPEADEAAEGEDEPDAPAAAAPSAEPFPLPLLCGGEDGRAASGKGHLLPGALGAGAAVHRNASDAGSAGEECSSHLATGSPGSLLASPQLAAPEHRSSSHSWAGCAPGASVQQHGEAATGVGAGLGRSLGLAGAKRKAAELDGAGLAGALPCSALLRPSTCSDAGTGAGPGSLAVADAPQPLVPAAAGGSLLSCGTEQPLPVHPAAMMDAERFEQLLARTAAAGAPPSQQ